MTNQERIQAMPESALNADAYHVARAMVRGGGFMEALSVAFQKADSENRRRIYTMWGANIEHEWAAYRRVGGW